MDIFTEIQDRLGSKKFVKRGRTSGGCVCKATTIETDDGIIFVKTSTDENALEMFNGEMTSLQTIAQTKTIATPETYFILPDPKSANGAALVMEYLDMKPVNDWAKLGSKLADLHLFNSVLGKKKRRLESWIGKPPKTELPSDISLRMEKNIKLKISDETVENVEYVDNFGFDTTTCCGRIPQNNEWHDNWIEFFARNRLELQINMATETYGDRKLIELWSELQLKIDKFFTNVADKIEPALLHGDLWSGNVAEVNDQPIIYDASSFYGHSEYELAIAKLFGGFDNKFYEEYFKKIPQEKEFRRRNELYILFHLLNHWNHFGGSFKGQSIQQISKLVKYY